MSLNPKQILSHIAKSDKPQTKRDIVRALSIKGNDRITLKKILRGLEEDGQIVKQGKGAYSIPNSLPAVAVVKVTEIDIDGDVFAAPTSWDEEMQGPAPRVEIMPDKRGHPALKEGDKALVRLKRYSDFVYEGQIMRRLDESTGRVLGMIQKTAKGYVLQPADKKAKHDFEVDQKDLNGANPGDLATGEILSARGLRRQKVKIIDVIGHRDDPKAISLIAMHETGLRAPFPAKVEEETKGMKVPPLGKREDLRKIPMVTIDGADARDFDDAVFAEETEDGFHLIVAIADVSFYVRHGTALNNEAYKRGNSTYFPDRVVPMLPEALSNDLCSLRPKEDRAALAAHLWINQDGELQRYKFVRALIRSHARLIYEDVQHGFEEKDDKLMPVLGPLYKAYDVLNSAREKRGALDLDLPERQILINEKGEMTGVAPRERLDSHKLIEEFMVLANVAAARALEDKKAPCVYRVHENPSAEKLDSAREFIEAFGIPLPKGQVIRPKQLNSILKQAQKTDYSHLISEVILRSQSQARYAIENQGHFGLALAKYGHFTSPIRRYADLLVHRSLVSAYGLGEGGLSDEERATLEEMADHISQTERTSIEAERSAIDRFTASWLAGRIGNEFEGKINGVTRFGLFVTLKESGADGLVPIRTLPQDFYVHDEKQHALIGRRSKRIYRLGANMKVRLTEADGFTGSSIFEPVDDFGADIPGIAFKTDGPRKNNTGKGPAGKNRPRKGAGAGKKQGKFRGKPGGR